MKKMLIAALMAAFAATTLPGVAAAQERDPSMLLPVAGGLGTVNWFLRPKGTTTFFKIGKNLKLTHTTYSSGPKFAATIGPKFATTAGSRFAFSRHHHHHKKIGSRTSEGFPYVVGAIWCAAAAPIITVAIEKRELSTDEVLWSTASCFFPPLALVGLFGGVR